VRSLKSYYALTLVVPLFAIALSMQAQPQGTVPSHNFVGETLSVDVDVVDVFFNVKQKDKFVENLSKDEFVLLENNKRQDIRYFSAETHAPLSLGMLIDTSDSESAVLQREQEVARRFLDQVLIEGDQGLIVSFDSYVDLKQEFTGNHDDLLNAISQARKQNSHRMVELDPGPMPKLRSTALYDSIAGAARYRFASRLGRKAMIIITDGQDMGSRNSAKDAIDAALRSNTICYVLLLGDQNYMQSSDYVGVQKMKYLASETGGRMILMDHKLKNLERSLIGIAAELRHHYSIGYTPIDRSHRGDYRRISIRSRRGYQVQSRRGYFATREPIETPSAIIPAPNETRASNQKGPG
jgi:VWFA-related protein